MILIEQTAVPVSALPVQAFRDHLRLGTGFGEDSLQDGLLEGYLRAALAAIEGRTGKALIARVFSWEVSEWRDRAAQALPLAPVLAVQSVVIADQSGTEQVVDAARYRLERDLHRPRLVAVGGALPMIPTGGTAGVILEAGFGPLWGDVPPDLAQAVLLLAASYYEHRHDQGLGTPGAMPFGVLSLIGRWRNVRTLGGGA